VGPAVAWPEAGQARRADPLGALDGAATLEAIATTSLDKPGELDALAALPEPDRAPQVEKAAAGENVSAVSKGPGRRTRTSALSPHKPSGTQHAPS
jgi:hypothetical protein